MMPSGKRAAGYGQGSAILDDRDLLEGAELMAALRAIFESPTYHPPMLPQVAMDVHALTKRTDVGLAAVVQLIQRDAMLAAAVLRRAQSPMYATKIAPRTLDDAAARLGMNGLRDLVFEVAMSGKVFRSDTFAPVMDAVRRHSVWVAHAARVVATETSIADDAVFLAGLLHDVGLVAGIHALTELVKLGQRVDLPTAAPVLRDTHLDAGTAIVRLWKLPDELGWIVGAHHDPMVQGFVHPVAACIVVAESLGEAMGAGLSLSDGPLEWTAPAALSVAQRSLGLDQPAIQRIVERVKRLAVA